MILFVKDNSGILFLKDTSIEIITKPTVCLVSYAKLFLNGVSKIDRII